MSETVIVLYFISFYQILLKYVRKQALYQHFFCTILPSQLAANNNLDQGK